MASRFISVTNADLETNFVHMVYCEKTAKRPRKMSVVEGVSAVRTLFGEAENCRWKTALQVL